MYVVTKPRFVPGSSGKCRRGRLLGGTRLRLQYNIEVTHMEIEYDSVSRINLAQKTGHKRAVANSLMSHCVP